MSANVNNLDKDKVKLFFTMLGEVVAMFISIFDIFKKKDANNGFETK